MRLADKSQHILAEYQLLLNAVTIRFQLHDGKRHNGKRRQPHTGAMDMQRKMQANFNVQMNRDCSPYTPSASVSALMRPNSAMADTARIAPEPSSVVRSLASTGFTWQVAKVIRYKCCGSKDLAPFSTYGGTKQSLASNGFA